jgi:hypothetical protein
MACLLLWGNRSGYKAGMEYLRFFVSVLSRFVQKPRIFLSGKTPQESASQATMKVSVAAILGTAVLATAQRTYNITSALTTDQLEKYNCL